jgi:hypothetical protein
MKIPLAAVPREEVERQFAVGKLSVQIDESVVASYQGEQGVLLDYSRGNYLGLNAVAALTWKLLEKGRPIDEIIETITNEYDVLPDRARRDIAQLVGDLHSLGIVRVCRRD